MTGKFYVYALCHETGEPFYIGKGQKDRIDHHEKEAKRGGESKKCIAIRKICESGGAIIKKILFESSDELEAYKEEGRQIELYGLENLTNKTKGGVGTLSRGQLPSLGIRLKPETKAALEIAAAADRRSMSSMAKKIFVEWLRENGYLPRNTRDQI